MSSTDKIIQDAIAKRLAEMTAVADACRAEDAELDAIMKWKAVPANVTDDQYAAIVVMTQANPMVAQMMDQDMLKTVFDTLNAMSQSDPARIQSIIQKAEAFQNKERLQPGVSLQVVAGAAGAGWAAAAVLVQVDDDLNVSLLDKLDNDLYLGLYTAPHNNRSLTGKFNMEMNYTMAGQKLRPVTIVGHDGPGTVQIHVRGHMQTPDGRMQPIAAIVPVTVGNAPSAAPKPGTPQP